MNIPENLLYTDEHEWVAPTDGPSLRIGITDFAQDALGDIVYFDAPNVGRHVNGGDSLAEVESTKSVAEVFAPLSGKITAVNTELETTPELINSDPYGAGWMFELQPESADWQSGLLSADAYREIAAT